MPLLILLTACTHEILNLEGMQQEGPANTLMFFPVVRLLATKIGERTSLGLQRWYADDCTLIGTQVELRRAVKILRSKGPQHGLYLNMAKTRLFWSRQPVNQPTPLLHRFASENFSNDGIDLLGAPDRIVSVHEDLAQRKVYECDKSLSLIEGIGDAHIRFHPPLICASACKLQHVVTLTPPSVTSAPCTEIRPQPSAILLAVK